MPIAEIPERIAERKLRLQIATRPTLSAIH
jgi:hypothetical protein